MPVIVAGYYMNFITSRAVMDKLKIHDRGTEDNCLEFLINNWLIESGRTTLLAGVIGHPSSPVSQEGGLLLMTHFVYDSSTSNPIVEERDIDGAVE
jgi:hypothetical protein